MGSCCPQRMTPSLRNKQSSIIMRITNKDNEQSKMDYISSDVVMGDEIIIHDDINDTDENQDCTLVPIQSNIQTIFENELQRVENRSKKMLSLTNDQKTEIIMNQEKRDERWREQVEELIQNKNNLIPISNPNTSQSNPEPQPTTIQNLQTPNINVSNSPSTLPITSDASDPSILSTYPPSPSPSPPPAVTNHSTQSIESVDCVCINFFKSPSLH